MILVEHKENRDIHHLVERDAINAYVRKHFTPGEYFTITDTQLPNLDKTYKVPNK